MPRLPKQWAGGTNESTNLIVSWGLSYSVAWRQVWRLGTEKGATKRASIWFGQIAIFTDLSVVVTSTAVRQLAGPLARTFA